MPAKDKTKSVSRLCQSNLAATGRQLFLSLLVVHSVDEISVNVAHCITNFPENAAIARPCTMINLSYDLNDHLFNIGRRGGLMVSALESGSGGLGSSPGWGTSLCSWVRHFTLIVPLSTLVYKWVPANLLLGVTLRWTSIPSRGE